MSRSGKFLSEESISRDCFLQPGSYRVDVETQSVKTLGSISERTLGRLVLGSEQQEVVGEAHEGNLGVGEVDIETVQIKVAE